MAPSRSSGTIANGHSEAKTAPAANEKKQPIDSIQLENLLLRDEEIFQTSLNSDDYLDSLAPIIKNAVKSNELSGLITKLNDIVQQKDEELNQVSIESMDEINQCMQTIASIHKSADDLNAQFLTVNQGLNKSAFELMTRKKSYTKYKEVCNRINETHVVLTECIQVLELMNRILDLIKQTRYFSALKLIDEMTNIHIQKVEEFSFAKKIVASTPHLTKMIEDDSFENLTKWLSIHLERKLRPVGETLYENLAELQDIWRDQQNKHEMYRPYKLNSPVELSLRDPHLNYDVFDDESLQIPLNNVYDAILVYSTLHELDTLRDIYYKEWMKKYSRIIYPLTSASANKKEIVFSNNELDEYLKKIAAFFVMDKQLNLITKFQLRTNNQSDDLWISFVSKLKPVLLYNLKRNDFYDLRELHGFKQIVGDFMQIMDSNEYDIVELYEVLMIIFKDYFAPLVVQDFRKQYIGAMQKELYTSLEVDERKYNDIIKTLFYHRDAPFAPRKVKNRFPVKLPFSEDYATFCKILHKLTTRTLKFIDVYYNYEINEIINIIVNDIFEEFLGEKKGYGIAWEIEDFIRKNSTNKEVTAQSFVNLEHYIIGLIEIGKLLNVRLRQETGMGIHNIDNNGTFTLKAVETFTKLKKFSEETLYQMVDTKLNELLDLVEYEDYEPPESERNTEANFSVKDFAMFLENLFTSIFENLSPQLRTLGLFRAYDFVSQYFLGILHDAPRFNSVFIDNFDLDIKYLEKSMKKLGRVEEAMDDASQGNVSIDSTFSELRQSVDLLKLDNYEEYLNNNTYRTRNFSSIKFDKGSRLISKMQGRDDAILARNPSVQRTPQRTNTISSISQSLSSRNFSGLRGNRYNDEESTSGLNMNNSNPNSRPVSPSQSPRPEAGARASPGLASMTGSLSGSRLKNFADRFKQNGQNNGQNGE
ncbi:SEC15 [Candida theae]|uniref:Exocyst complex component SEC15 n=1 Tax=Candida theae TaxID=1198502 RepID=A0AAD5BBW9_9ASCO|nr:SEC15 [Candida theae]KAI5953035.1 SEC15 [Candida theae]